LKVTILGIAFKDCAGKMLRSRGLGDS
jgi:hypothetical protein